MTDWDTPSRPRRSSRSCELDESESRPWQRNDRTLRSTGGRKAAALDDSVGQRLVRLAPGAGCGMPSGQLAIHPLVGAHSETVETLHHP